MKYDKRKSKKHITLNTKIYYILLKQLQKSLQSKQYCLFTSITVKLHNNIILKMYKTTTPFSFKIGHYSLKYLSQTIYRKPHKMVKDTQAIRRLLLTNCLSVFDHFEGVALKGLTL